MAQATVIRTVASGDAAVNVTMAPATADVWDELVSFGHGWRLDYTGYATTYATLPDGKSAQLPIHEVAYIYRCQTRVDGTAALLGLAPGGGTFEDFAPGLQEDGLLAIDGSVEHYNRVPLDKTPRNVGNKNRSQQGQNQRHSWHVRCWLDSSHRVTWPGLEPVRRLYVRTPAGSGAQAMGKLQIAVVRREVNAPRNAPPPVQHPDPLLSTLKAVVPVVLDYIDRSLMSDTERPPDRSPLSAALFDPAGYNHIMLDAAIATHLSNVTQDGSPSPFTFAFNTVHQQSLWNKARNFGRAATAALPQTVASARLFWDLVVYKWRPYISHIISAERADELFPRPRDCFNQAHAPPPERSMAEVLDEIEELRAEKEEAFQEGLEFQEALWAIQASEKEKDAQIADLTATITARDAVIATQNAHVADLTATIIARDATIVRNAEIMDRMAYEVAALSVFE